jgi:hypothetical protein
VLVRTLTGEELEVTCPLVHTVLHLKVVLEERTGIPAWQIVLIPFSDVEQGGPQEHEQEHAHEQEREQPALQDDDYICECLAPSVPATGMGRRSIPSLELLLLRDSTAGQIEGEHPAAVANMGAEQNHSRAHPPPAPPAPPASWARPVAAGEVAVLKSAAAQESIDRLLYQVCAADSTQVSHAAMHRKVRRLLLQGADPMGYRSCPLRVACTLSSRPESRDALPWIRCWQRCTQRDDVCVCGPRRRAAHRANTPSPLAIPPTFVALLAGAAGGKTALHWACEKGHGPTILALLFAGADVRAVSWECYFYLAWRRCCPCIGQLTAVLQPVVVALDLRDSNDEEGKVLKSEAQEAELDEGGREVLFCGEAV